MCWVFLSTCVVLYHLYTWCLRRPERAVVSCYVGSNLGHLEDCLLLFTAEVSLLPLVSSHNLSEPWLMLLVKKG